MFSRIWCYRVYGKNLSNSIEYNYLPCVYLSVARRKRTKKLVKWCSQVMLASFLTAMLYTAPGGDDGTSFTSLVNQAWRSHTRRSFASRVTVSTTVLPAVVVILCLAAIATPPNGDGDGAAGASSGVSSSLWLPAVLEPTLRHGVTYHCWQQRASQHSLSIINQQQNNYPTAIASFNR